MPSRNGHNGRGPDGRFVAGNPGGPGNPLGRKVGQLRAALIDAVDVADIRDIADTLIQQARGGDIDAMKLLFDRTLGRVVEADLLQRLENLERSMLSEPV